MINVDMKSLPSSYADCNSQREEHEEQDHKDGEWCHCKKITPRLALRPDVCVCMFVCICLFICLFVCVCLCVCVFVCV